MSTSSDEKVKQLYKAIKKYKLYKEKSDQKEIEYKKEIESLKEELLKKMSQIIQNRLMN